MKYLILLVSLIIIETLFAQNPAPQAYPCSNLSNQLNTFDGTHSNPRCINVFGDPNTVINGTQNVTLKAGETISIKDDVHVTSIDGAAFHAVIEKSGFETVWFTPEANIGNVPKYHKLELGFKLSDEITNLVDYFLQNDVGGMNPYNPDEIEIHALLTGPSGTVKHGFGFYYIPYEKNIAANTIDTVSTDYNWRLRFAPDELGQWDAVINVKINGVIAHSQGLSFECIPSSHKGYIQRSYNNNESDRQLYFSETGETFFGIGGNVCHSSYDHAFTVEKNERHKMWLGKLADAGGNFFRLELGEQNALPDWYDIDNYTNKMQQMYLYDEIIDYAFLRELYFIMFRHHVEVTRTVNSITVANSENPYINNVNFNGWYDYFENQDILQYQFKTLKYIFARWGYSPNFAIYEYQEVDRWMFPFWEDDEGEMPVQYNATFRNWFIKIKDVIRFEIKNNRTLLSVAYAVTPKYEKHKLQYFNYNGVFDHCDLATFHSYNSIPDVNFVDRYKDAKDSWKKVGKPFIIEEIGEGGAQIPLYCCTDMTFHNDIWSTAMMGGISCGLDWWWDRGIYLKDYQTKYKTLQLFFKNENLRSLQVKPQKWDKNSQNTNTYIRNYASRSKNKTRVLGWVMNPSYHWRSHYSTDNCIQSLVDNNIANPDCVFEDGHITEDASFLDPQNPGKYIFEDANFHPIYSALNISNNPVFKIKNLKTTIWQLFGFKKHWYKVEFYNTRTVNPTVLAPSSLLTQIIHTNVLSRLKPYCPNLTQTSPDYAYKVTYLGKYSNEPSGIILQQEYEAEENIERGISIRPIDNTEENEQAFEPVIDSEPSLVSEDNEITIYPNPSSGQFLIQSKLFAINSIFISNLSGEEILNLENLNLTEVEINLTKEISGYLLVKVVTSNNEISNLKILIHE